MLYYIVETADEESQVMLKHRHYYRLLECISLSRTSPLLFRKIPIPSSI